ncbi:MAG: UDP-N-acetylmuramoyl-L-alanyl-D-glutamate--2,6-diaminopimelate ligase [Alphaproteobacteria bacterium MarineAlpha11_Bin1]|nr:MAG: UDP-N-acetylmuramoyl-L-alanyl-D-glutamate--2,6-diaminopimelate ligase [Alphaproteobacteria bacterium MarineAlpha11_Bin1]
MQLIDLISGDKIKVTLTADISELDITGLTADSRDVRPGFLFAALPGLTVDGRNYISTAIEKGAAAVLAPDDTDPPDGAALIKAADARATLAHMAAAFYRGQPGTVAAVTGTNGKTSVAHFTSQIWSKIGNCAVSIGTLGLQSHDGTIMRNLTTPEPVSLHENLAKLDRDGVTHAVLEASSHGLDQHRIDGIRLTAAAFTNLTRDHLDYHGTAENYFTAKARLFAELLPSDGVAVLNADSPDSVLLSKLFGGRTLTYGRAGSDFILRDAAHTPRGTYVKLTIMGRNINVELPLAGTFQIHNVLCAVGLTIGCGADCDTVINCLDTLESVPGRMQLAGTVSGGSVYIDYAHTPDALLNVLTALRPHTKGRLISVVGCGGDRDRGKRPEMGSISGRLADITIVTDDNPRSEDASQIRSAILAAAPGAMEIGNRSDAIHAAISEITSGDVVLIAGKGHETGQIVGDKTLPFNDLDIAQTAIDTAGGKLS